MKMSIVPKFRHVVWAATGIVVAILLAAVAHLGAKQAAKGPPTRASDITMPRESPCRPPHDPLCCAVEVAGGFGR